MILPASSEFIALCQAQVALLARILGATSTIIYLTERTVDHPNPALVPVVAYPDLPEPWSPMDWQRAASIGLLPGTAEGRDSASERGDVAPLAPDLAGRGGITALDLEPPARPDPGPGPSRAQDLAPAHQMVLPMAHEGIVLGVLVSTREGYPWQVEERQQAERIADTLTLARVLDQRGQWLEQQLQRKQLTQHYQSETFHDLLHQFRNPLTALRTFGKLLVKRIQPEDANQPIAEGIVRESERLQDLVQHFDEAVAVGDADLHSAEQPPVTPQRLLPGAGQTTRQLSSASSAGSPGLNPEEPAAPAWLSGLHLGVELHPEPLQWAVLLGPLLISADAVAQERQIGVSAAIPADLPPVWADPRALREVASNLLDNALKYSPAGATVWVQAGLFREEAGHIYQGVAVGDTGPGIPQADQAHIFERHYRGIQAQGEIPGTGLGLAIAAELVQDLGGQITLLSPASLSGLVPPQVNSQSPAQGGPGTVFIVWLPQVQG